MEATSSICNFAGVGRETGSVTTGLRFEKKASVSRHAAARAIKMAREPEPFIPKVDNCRGGKQPIGLHESAANLVSDNQGIAENFRSGAFVSRPEERRN